MSKSGPGDNPSLCGNIGIVLACIQRETEILLYITCNMNGKTQIINISAFKTAVSKPK